MPKQYIQNDEGNWAEVGTGEVRSSPPFDAQAHMRKIRTRQGMQDYLDVKWRVSWVRDDYPDARIVTECIQADEKGARFKCTITLVNGGISTGHGSETVADFPDAFEKAETKAIGRALANLGYGTDSAIDLDDGSPLDGPGAVKEERAAQRAEPEPPATPEPNIRELKEALVREAQAKNIPLTWEMDKVQIADTLKLFTQHAVTYAGVPRVVMERFREIVAQLPAQESAD